MALSKTSITWSPQLLMIGMLMSSTNTVIFLPAGGPYVVPIRLSTRPSIVRWNMSGVVALEKLKLLNMWSSGSYLLQNPWIITVLAVPWCTEIKNFSLYTCHILDLLLRCFVCSDFTSCIIVEKLNQVKSINHRKCFIILGAKLIFIPKLQMLYFIYSRKAFLYLIRLLIWSCIEIFWTLTREENWLY